MAKYTDPRHEVWEGPECGASIPPPCGIKMHHPPGTSMCFSTLAASGIQRFYWGFIMWVRLTESLASELTQTLSLFPEVGCQTPILSHLITINSGMVQGPTKDTPITQEIPKI